jgi:hypothetical protein
VGPEPQDRNGSRPLNSLAGTYADWEAVGVKISSEGRTDRRRLVGELSREGSHGYGRHQALSHEALEQDGIELRQFVRKDAKPSRSHPDLEIRRRVFTDRGCGSIWHAATGPGLLGLDRLHQPDPAGLARASSSRSIGRRADTRSLRSARESLFRSREARNWRRQQDPRPKRGVARSCFRPDDRSEVH